MIFEKVRKIIAEELSIDEGEIKLETSFEELGVDSLDLFQVIMSIEEEFNIEVLNAENMKTVKDAVKYIESK
ncbi:MAG: acyl carrier protein [Clostridiaceae bacterium]